MNTASLPMNSTNVRKFIALNSLRTGLGLAARLSRPLALAWAERLFLTPPRHDWPAAEQGWRDRAEQGVLHTAGLPQPEWDGKPMRTYRWGEARRGKVAVLHGWGGRATQFHAFVAPLVAAGYQVIGIDAPAHGASAGRQASVLHFAHALERLLRNEGHVDALIAHSLGGPAAIYALATARLDVDRVALIAPAIDVAAYARQVARLLGLDDGLRDAMQLRMETRFGIQWRELHGAARAAQLRQPALIVHDRGDREVPSAAGVAIAEAWPGAQLQLTDGLGHNRILRDAAVVERVIEFVRG